MKTQLERDVWYAVDLILTYGQVDGAHHKMWLIDQVLRMLTKENYDEIIKNWCLNQEEDECELEWDIGISP